MFNSQNNAAGGYACPRAVGGPTVVTPRSMLTKILYLYSLVYYYVGSKLRIEWTSQHSCGVGNSHCQVVLQYFCNGTTLKDGIPTDQNDAATDSTTLTTFTNDRFALHEPPTMYTKCKTRDRVKGLFAADETINGNNAMFTRQNENGAEYGFECQEERDHYPYWQPTPWKDIAIFTSNVTMCPWYQMESQNVKNKGECYDIKTKAYAKYNNPQECKSNNGDWVESGAHGIPPPECLSADKIAARDNHLGNTAIDGEMAYYIWTIPNDIADSCVFRLRYNISTADYHPFTTDSTYNGARSPVKQDPREDYGHGAWLSLALNTNQYGRTFQDRSYVFAIKPRPTTDKELGADSTIWNLNVRGKRGNIVDVYPSVEYDFVPNKLFLQGGDYIHIQWIGSDYNPNRNPNNAEGGPVDPANANNYRADRNNLVEIEYFGSNLPKRVERTRMFLKSDGQVDTELLYKLAFIGQQNNTGQCLSFEALKTLNGNNEDNADKDTRNCGKLNSAPNPYFDAGLVRVRTSGTFSYMSSRNNNFSNRGQKAQIIVNGGWFSAASRFTVSNLLLALVALIAFFML